METPAPKEALSWEEALTKIVLACGFETLGAFLKYINSDDYKVLKEAALLFRSSVIEKLEEDLKKKEEVIQQLLKDEKESADDLDDIASIANSNHDRIIDLEEQNKRLQAFKDYVHQRLDEAGVEKEPNGEH